MRGSFANAEPVGRELREPEIIPLGNVLQHRLGGGIHALQVDGTITGGMIPKLETCVKAVESGVDAAVILDGRVPHAMLLEIFTDRGAGTLIRK